MRLINKYNLLLLNVENDEVIDCVNILIKKKNTSTTEWGKLPFKANSIDVILSVLYAGRFPNLNCLFKNISP